MAAVGCSASRRRAGRGSGVAGFSRQNNLYAALQLEISDINKQQFVHMTPSKQGRRRRSRSRSKADYSRQLHSCQLWQRTMSTSQR